MYKYRLVFSHARAGVLRFPEAARSLNVAGLPAIISARGADSLEKATRFDIEVGGFADEESARVHGAKIRNDLQIVNALLGLGFLIPVNDGTSGALADDIKKKLLDEHDAVVLNTIVGLGVFPDDGRHGELIVTGEAEAYPSDPQYILDALTQTSCLDLKVSDEHKEVLDVLARASRESSPRSRFILCYFALERMIERKERSNDAKKMIESFIDQARDNLPASEFTSLRGSLASLTTHSFGSALREFAPCVTNPTTIAGLQIGEFFSQCIDARNKVAHQADKPEPEQLQSKR